MRADVIVLFQLGFDDDPSLSDRSKLPSIENLPAQGAVEALVVAVFPSTPRIDADGLDPNFGKLGLEILSDELRTIV